MASRALVIRTAIVAAVLTLLGWVGYELIHAGSDVPPPSGQNLTRLTGGSAAGKRLDGKGWSLDYTSATLSADGSIADITDVHDGVIRRNGKPYMHMRAQHVSANIADNSFSVTGPVSFEQISPPKRRLETTDAVYTGSTQVLTLPKPVTIHEAPSLILHISNAKVNFKSGDMTLGRIEARS